MGFIGNYELGLQDNIGVRGMVVYSSYSESNDAGEWKYSNILIMASSSYHCGLLKNEKLDTWGALNIG
jgi:hypothetical protein